MCDFALECAIKTDYRAECRWCRRILLVASPMDGIMTPKALPLLETAGHGAEKQGCPRIANIM